MQTHLISLTGRETGAGRLRRLTFEVRQKQTNNKPVFTTTKDMLGRRKCQSRDSGGDSGGNSGGVTVGKALAVDLSLNPQFPCKVVAFIW